MIAELIIEKELFYYFEEACEEIGVKIEKLSSIRANAYHVTIVYRNTNDLFVLGMEFIERVHGHN